MYRSLLLNMLLLCIVYGSGMNYTGPCTGTSKLEFSQSCLALSYVVLCCVVLSCLVFALSCHALSYLILFCPVLSCFMLSCVVSCRSCCLLSYQAGGHGMDLNPDLS